MSQKQIPPEQATDFVIVEEHLTPEEMAENGSALVDGEESR